MRSSTSPRADTTITGTSPTARMARQTSTPSTSGRPRSSSTTSTPARWSATPAAAGEPGGGHPVPVQGRAQRGGDPVVVLDQQDVHPLAVCPMVGSDAPPVHECYTSATLWVAQGAGLWCPIRPSVPPCPEALDDRRTPPMIRMAGRRQALRRRCTCCATSTSRSTPARSWSCSGPSGSGKSTLCRTINRLEPIDSGTIEVDGKPLPAEGKALARAARRRRHGVPELQPVRPQDDPARTSPSPRSRSARPTRPRREKQAHGAAGAGRHRQPGGQVPRPALRRPAAAGGHRPGAGHEARR